MKPAKLIVKGSYLSKYRKGYPLVLKEALQNPEALREEGQLIRLYDERNGFIGVGYHGLQNKGVGWILDRQETAVIDYPYLKNRILKAVGHRKGLYESSDTTAFRVFNGEGDGIGGLVIDYYDGYYVISYYSQGIYAWREWVRRALSEIVGYLGLYEKKRFDEAGKYITDDDFIGGEPAPEPLVICENGIRYAVYLNDGAMVGIFLDQRQVRQAVRERYARGRTVLNTFSYTGAFSVAAALGGAEKTVSVDLANRSLAKTLEQMSLNGIDTEAQEILVEDVFNFFRHQGRRGERYGLVILDPPSYAKSKEHIFAAEKDYTELLKQAIALTEPGGLILASTNCSAFDMEKFKGFAHKAFEACGIGWRLLQTFSLPEDFRTVQEYPEGSYLKVMVIETLKE